MTSNAVIPSASDVEVYQAGVHFPGKYLPHVKEVVLLEDHHAHITRLTAERDAANTALDTYLKLLNEVITERDALQADLTFLADDYCKRTDELIKARELNEANLQLLRQLEHAGLFDNWKARVSRAISDSHNKTLGDYIIEDLMDD